MGTLLTIATDMVSDFRKRKSITVFAGLFGNARMNSPRFEGQVLVAAQKFKPRYLSMYLGTQLWVLHSIQIRYPRIWLARCGTWPVDVFNQSTSEYVRLSSAALLP